MGQHEINRGDKRVSHRILDGMAWLGAAVLCYLVVSLLMITPAEHRLRRSNRQLQREYRSLLAKHDSLAMVVENVVARDKNVFAMIFDSEPYDFNSEYNTKRVELYEALLSKSNGEMYGLFDSSLAKLEQKMATAEESYAELNDKLRRTGLKRNNIPAIQPVKNDELTLLTSAYGQLMHPFYRTLHNHQGVDYAIAEGTNVVATADGVVTNIKDKYSTSGITITINHHNGYTTSYAHLQNAKVKVGQKVRRGEVIAHSGNTGLSLAPHLHYEVRYNDMRVDPIHYFFMELTADEYQRIMRIAQSGMQSFD